MVKINKIRIFGRWKLNVESGWCIKKTAENFLLQELNIFECKIAVLKMIQILFLGLFFQSSLALYPSSGSVVELTPSNFDKLVIKGDEVWVVEFFAPWCGHCKNLVPEYTKAANALKGIVKVGAVDVDQHKEIGGQYGIRGFPTIKIFGADKRKPEDFNGGRTAKDIVEGALKAAKAKAKANLGLGGGSQSDDSDNSHVVELTDSNFEKLVLKSDDMWLVEFFAPWCGHCKNLAPHWAKAAAELKGKVKLGALDATVHQARASLYGVQGYPTIKFFGPDAKDSPTDYDGGRTSSDIVTWALDKLEENIPAPEVTQILDDKSFKKLCEDKPLCVVAVLPHILDCQSECRNNYIKMLAGIGETFKKKMWGWVWSEAGTQLDLENSLDIGGFGYPAMAVINSKKMKYSILRGSFSKDGIYEFLRSHQEILEATKVSNQFIIRPEIESILICDLVN
ncbi:protein disulfide-isomerase A6 homolog isoform X7 [Diabrotica virgifera virgifera]|uniref:Thioredoxin domain-containing protein n=1 Tax=Diabrotica virgifera virgifera TaxID=50390 RepID=A0ABM5LB59_DIAVI|nr:protein disulfide-isomerase A6 homolog isoform X6 [Diabrotica virgifera virgifera]XP_050519677.1 protein disulfide-isomerase A6 homolog isoform X7 [Diabrotica virgifera virgifera]